MCSNPNCKILTVITVHEKASASMVYSWQLKNLENFPPPPASITLVNYGKEYTN